MNSSSTNGPDGLPSTSSGKNTATDPPTDPVVDEHGVYFFVQEDGRITINQVAVAAKFALDRQIYYDEDSGCFRQYDAKHGHFPPIKEPQVKWHLADFLKRLAEENDVESFLAKRTNSLLNSLLDLLRGHVGELAPEFESRCLFHVGNGMLDIGPDGVKLLPFDPRYRSKRFCPINYVPGAKCPRFLNELLGPAVVAEDIDLLQRWLGSLAIGENLAQRFLVVHGVAAAGKSTFVDAAEQLVGIENVAEIRTQHLGTQFESHSLLNKTLLTAKDVASNFLSAKGARMIKALTGNDSMQAEKKFGGKKQFRGNFNMVVTSNARPQVEFDDDAEAWRRRLLVVEFKRERPAQRIPNFARLLIQEEGEGILVWVVEGAMKHLREIKDVGDFILTTGQRERIDCLLNESRSAEYFVEKSMEFVIKGDLSVEEIRQAYFEYCEKREWRPLTPRQFENELGDLMLKIHSSQKRTDIRRHGSFVRGFKNVKLVAG